MKQNEGTLSALQLTEYLVLAPKWQAAVHDKFQQVVEFEADAALPLSRSAANRPVLTPDASVDHAPLPGQGGVGIKLASPRARRGCLPKGQELLNSPWGNQIQDKKIKLEHLKTGKSKVSQTTPNVR